MYFKSDILSVNTHSTLANIGTVSYLFANDNTVPLTPDMVGVAR